MKVTKAQSQALAILADGPMPETALVIFRIQQRTMAALVQSGLVKWSPYGKPPNWRITQAGRSIIQTL